jgi:cell division protein FtsL
MNKRNTVFYLSLVVIIISIAFSLSYAYMSAKVTGNDTATKTTISSANLDIDFTTSEYINNSKLSLISDSDVATKADKTTFTVANTKATTTVNYDLTLTEVAISDNLKSSDFKWELLKNDVSLSNGNFSTAITGTDITLTPSAQSITVGTTDSYVLRIWLSETNKDQLALTNGTFSAKVKLTASNS